MTRPRSNDQSTSNLKPKLRVTYRRVEVLLPFARNARTHSDAQVAQLAASIKEFGWTNPILVDGNNGIVAGHGRLLAAKSLGMKDVPVIELAGLSDAQRRAYVLADNKLALNAGWDEELLALELGDLRAMGSDLNLVGFSDKELERILPPAGNAGAGTAPYESAFQILIECADEPEQLRLLKQLQSEGVKCRALIA